MTEKSKEVLILGGGLTGLSAGYVLSKAGFGVKVFESDDTVGGLSKTIVHNGYRFDLGGHRFFTNNNEIDNFVKDLMTDELILVPRKSKILMRDKYFDYPLKPFNAMFGLGIPTSMKIVFDYGIERLKQLMKKPDIISLEDWVVNNFGRTMFNIYFKEYSEKVWGMDCKSISVDWVSQRIKGLSLFSAVKNAFFKFSGKDIPSLVDRFVYPELGIGRISDRLMEEIDKDNKVFTDAGVLQVNHAGFKIENIKVKNNGSESTVEGDEFISSIPMTKLVTMLNPAPPEDILKAASSLNFRDIVIVAIMVDRKRVTDQTWIYIPEQKIPFGRIHEPTNWSEKMAPDGKTILVIEYFSFKGDKIWSQTDEELTDITVENLERLGFVDSKEVEGSVVLRIPKAYPLFEVGYREICDKIYDYLGKFTNLQIAGRVGMFRYYNMDHAIESGINAAEKIMKNSN